MGHLFLQALKRDKDIYELAKKAEQKSSGQPANTDESDINDAIQAPGMLMQPVRYANELRPVAVKLKLEM